MRISDWSSDVCSSDLLLHALAHIELNAIDLAADIVARFTAEALPRGFYDDWLTVADEEGKHYLLLAERLAALGFAYGDLPAHAGQIGRASCRERVCQYGEISVVAVSLKKKYNTESVRANKLYP